MINLKIPKPCLPTETKNGIIFSPRFTQYYPACAIRYKYNKHALYAINPPYHATQMTRIGILSDTHGYLDERIFHYFEECHEIWHAGDIGAIEVGTALENFKPLRAVFGNIDGHLLRQQYPENYLFRCERVPVFITHIAGNPPRYNASVLTQVKENQPAILVCGHSHLLKVLRVPQYNNMLHINPGAAGKSGFHKVRTLIRLSIDQERIFDLEVVELGKR